MTFAGLITLKSNAIEQLRANMAEDEKHKWQKNIDVVFAVELNRRGKKFRSSKCTTTEIFNISKTVVWKLCLEIMRQIVPLDEVISAPYHDLVCNFWWLHFVTG